MAGYETYETFDEFLAAQAAEQQEIISALRRFVNKTVPGLSESSKWGGGVWLKDDLPVIFTNTHTGVVQLGFFAGSSLNDPAGVLKGSSKFIRHIDISSSDDIDKLTLEPLVKQAAEINYKKQ